ncbi:MAG: tetratricopeptide repeat protein [Spirochaetes bacterium]|nr:tetratricopeptide repeat protein [Spirochaetota bacterium]MBN2770813.1 tetratricopeptide repeat protein [Spirochaetota bacterium]
MKKIIIALVFAACFLNGTIEARERITMFNSETETPGWTGVIIGRVISLGAREIADKELRQLAQEKTKVTVRIDNREGLLPGDELFVLDNKNLIVSRFTVVTINESRSFGYLLVGYGNFRRVQRDFRVAQHSKKAMGKNAYIHKARGDYHYTNGDTAKAIVEYEKAISVNDKYAESHIELGYIYLEKGIYQYALTAFDKAYKARSFIYDREDLLRLYNGIIRVRSYNAYSLELSNHKIIKRNIEEGIKVAREAVSLFPNSFELYYSLGRFYYENPEPHDVDAKNAFIRVLELQPNHVNSMVMLSELYNKHGNPERAMEYARKAISIDPVNKRARDILFKNEN